MRHLLIRSVLLSGVCALILGAAIILEHELTNKARLVCPPGWWRESPGLCAFPPVSIAVPALVYNIKALALLLAFAWLAPLRKLACCSALLASLALWPIFQLVFTKPSWIAVVSLSGVAIIAWCFALGVYVTTKIRTN